MATIAAPDDQMPILGLRARDVPERVLVVGDPARAELVASRLDGVDERGRNREYVTFVGQYAPPDVDQATPVAVVSHGVGSAGATVCFEELCRSGARRLIRAGTCGGMQPDVRDGDLVIATAAVRDDGITQKLVPIEFPAVADPDLLLALRRAGGSGDREPKLGVVLTSDLFYPHDVLGGNLLLWQSAGVLAVEMECSALLITAALHGVAAGAILTVDGNPLADADEDMSGYDPHRPIVHDAVDAMITIALDALTA